MDKLKILIVEDEPGLILTLKDRLVNENYEVDIAENGELGYQKASSRKYHCIILDLMLPKKSGLDVCRDLRANGISTPILMLTAKGQVIDKVLGLKMGADDYLPKPFDFMELLARIEAILRRGDLHSQQKKEQIFTLGSIELNTQKGTLTKSGKAIQVSAKEFQLLQFMLERKDDLLSREMLLNEVWGYESMPSTRTVDVHIAWLRQKLEEDPKHPKHIVTVHGMGYKLVD